MHCGSYISYKELYIVNNFCPPPPKKIEFKQVEAKLFRSKYSNYFLIYADSLHILGYTFQLL